MKCFTHMAAIAITPLLYFSAAWASPSTISQDALKSNQEIAKSCNKCCPGRCPVNVDRDDYTHVRGTHLEFKVDDSFSENPFLTGPAGLTGFSEFLGFDLATTEAYWRTGLDYIQARFGIDTSTATFDSVAGTTYLTVAPDGTSVQTEEYVPDQTNLVINALTTTGGGTYRVVDSTAPVIKTSCNCRPAVRLAEFVLSFTGDITLRGTYGEEVSETGSVVAAAGNGLAFGRYVIRGVNGYNYFFDMRAYIPNYIWPSIGDPLYIAERFQVNPLNRAAFGGPGLGTLSVVASITANSEGLFPVYIRNDWWFGPVVSFPALVDWDSIPGNTSLIPPGSSVSGRCP